MVSIMAVHIYYAAMVAFTYQMTPIRSSLSSLPGFSIKFKRYPDKLLP